MLHFIAVCLLSCGCRTHDISGSFWLGPVHLLIANVNGTCTSFLPLNLRLDIVSSICLPFLQLEHLCFEIHMILFDLNQIILMTDLN